MPGRRRVIPVIMRKDGTAYPNPNKKPYYKSMRIAAKPAGVPRPTKALRSVVNRMINRKIETKYVMYRPYNNDSGLMLNTNFTQAINSSGEAYALIPPISLGDGDHQRTGNVINPTSLTVKGFVSLLENAVDSAFLDVDVYILRHKSIKDVRYQSQLGNFADLKNSGDGLNVGYDGSWTHSIMPINTSTYQVLGHRRLRLQKGWGDANTYISLAAEARAAYNENPSHQKSFTFKVKMPKRLLYKTDADTTPSMDYPFMVIGWNVPTNLDTTSSNQIIKATATTHLYYKDP